MKVVGFGDNIVDRFIDRKVMYPGGNCVNFAVLAKKLGAESAYLGVFGSDELGEFVRSALIDNRVAIERCLTRDGPNGLTEIQVRAGDRIFLGWNGGGVTISDPFVLGPGDLDYLAGFDLVHSSVYSASVPQLPALRSTGALVSFDYSSEPEHRSAGFLARTAPYVDLALLSLGGMSEADAVAELERVVAAGAPIALGTRGEQGALLAAGGEIYAEPAAPTDPSRFIDTMACGDAFLTAAVLSLLEGGWTRERFPGPPAFRRALSAAAAAAAEQCYVEGAFGGGRAVGTPIRII
ncbi:sugar kinase [Arthrobacter sp. MSA 4-2]|uniref:PfkB family carbohydrate kinase n=1 Tax=Arthrobacter sp. MSA 4-2 TaxID=2794349 RepID=UPI0018E73616|nr:PfkB family carbohydrate kinase [Arthrobacter sp. MSA 4-2]MBJ2121842.1 sugar kinase [Arthrobacter sp. MSA 4-2]